MEVHIIGKFSSNKKFYLILTTLYNNRELQELERHTKAHKEYTKSTQRAHKEHKHFPLLLSFCLFVFLSSAEFLYSTCTSFTFFNFFEYIRHKHVHFWEVDQSEVCPWYTFYKILNHMSDNDVFFLLILM